MAKTIEQLRIEVKKKLLTRQVIFVTLVLAKKLTCLEVCAWQKGA